MPAMEKLDPSRHVLNLEDHLPLLRKTAVLDRNVSLLYDVIENWYDGIATSFPLSVLPRMLCTWQLRTNVASNARETLPPFGQHIARHGALVIAPSRLPSQPSDKIVTKKACSNNCAGSQQSMWKLCSELLHCIAVMCMKPERSNIV
jgi:hypothetical protein